MVTLRSFSFLYRNERTATDWNDRPHPQSCYLSVSSIGTNELQRDVTVHTIETTNGTFSFLYRNERTATTPTTKLLIDSLCFQFPLSERTNCNEFIKRVREKHGHVFQFPLSERTNCNARLTISPLASRFTFQFPLSERTNCNEQYAAPRDALKHLSVSSIGTNELQLFSVMIAIKCSSTFSFLYRNERTATAPPIAAARPACRLSVSSIGTNELQPIGKNLLQLQHCNLSVSSIGTNELQQAIAVRVANQDVAFSFLYRNERTATAYSDKPTSPASCFQFPLSERTNCNRALASARISS